MKTTKKWSKKNYGYFEGIVSVILNTLLFAIKLWIGILFNSIAMIADAWHTLSDTLTSVIVIIGFWISGKPADKNHPFGHGRAETIGTVIIGILLIIVGIKFLADSINRLINFQSSTFNIIAIIVFLTSFILKEALAQLSFIFGKKISSPSLTADGWHHRSDAIASILIVVGALFSKNFWWMDGVLGIIVSLFILFAAIQITFENTSLILGQDIKPEEKNNIKNLVLRLSKEIKDIHHFHFHKYGDHVELTFHIRVSPNMSVGKAHELANSIEKKIKEKFDYDTTVHVEPI